MLQRGRERWTVRGLACASLVALASGAACNNFALPTPPDTSQLVQAYLQPTGHLDPTRASDFEQSAAQETERMRQDAPFDLVSDLITRLEDVGGGAAGPDAGAGAGTQTLAGNTIDVAAYATLRVTCAGWGGSSSDASNGFAELTLALDKGGLIPTLWGPIDHCRLQRGDMSLEFDGQLIIHADDELPRVGLRALQQLGYLFQLQGSIAAMSGDAGVNGNVTLGFRVLPSGTVQVLIPLRDGTHVVAEFAASELSPDSQTTQLTARVLTRDQTFQCDLDLAQASGQCKDTSDPEASFSW